MRVFFCLKNESVALMVVCFMFYNWKQANWNGSNDRECLEQFHNLYFIYISPLKFTFWLNKWVLFLIYCQYGFSSFGDRLNFLKGNTSHVPLKFFSKFMNSDSLECNLKLKCFSRRMDNYYAWCRLKCLVLLSVSTKSSPMHKDLTV